MATKARTMYCIRHCDGAYLYQVVETPLGNFEPDHHSGATLKRKNRKGQCVTAEYGPDAEKAMLFWTKAAAQEFIDGYKVLRFCSIGKRSAAEIRAQQKN